MRVDIDDANAEWDESGRYLYNGEPVTGEVVETDGSGNVVVVTALRNGLPHGPDRFFYADGTLEKEIILDDGRVLSSRGWYPNGQLAEERVFDGGRLVEIRKWAEDGTPKQEEPRV